MFPFQLKVSNLIVGTPDQQRESIVPIQQIDRIPKTKKETLVL